MDSGLMKRHLTGRLVPLNKVHPEIPHPHQMRPRIALSPMLKLLESRFKDKLDDYMNNQMVVSQTGFVKGCGTHVNICRLVRKCKESQNKNERAVVLFIDFKSAYNNVPLKKLFNILQQKEILDEDEIEFIRALYSNTTLKVGDNNVYINKGVMQGSTISPALFNIFLEPLLLELSEITGVDDIFAYADDVVVFCNSISQLNKVIEIIRNWSRANEIPINFDKSGILNILSRKNSLPMIRDAKISDVPVVGSYKYLGIWLNETLDPAFHLEKKEGKVDFLTRKLKIIPKHSTTPRLLIIYGHC